MAIGIQEGSESDSNPRDWWVICSKLSIYNISHLHRGPSSKKVDTNLLESLSSSFPGVRVVRAVLEDCSCFAEVIEVVLSPCCNKSSDFIFI